jgi:Smg8_Smg9
MIDFEFQCFAPSSMPADADELTSLASKYLDRACRSSSELRCIGFVGSTMHGKQDFLRRMIGPNVSQIRLESTTSSSSSRLSVLQFFKSNDAATSNDLYVLLNEASDLQALCSACSAFSCHGQKFKSSETFLQWFEGTADSCSVRALLYLFHICHAIVFVSERLSFDLRLVRLLSALQRLKSKLAPSIANRLSSLDSQQRFDVRASSLFLPGRCVPALGFLFDCELTCSNTSLRELERSMHAQIAAAIRAASALRFVTPKQLGNLSVPLHQRAASSSSSASSASSSSSAPLFAMASERDCAVLAHRVADWLPVQPIDTLYDDLCESFERAFNAQPSDPELDQDSDNSNSTNCGDDDKRRQRLLRFVGALPPKRAGRRDRPSASTWLRVAAGIADMFAPGSARVPNMSNRASAALQQMSCTVPALSERANAACVTAREAAHEHYLLALPACYARYEHRARVELALRHYDAQSRWPAHAAHRAALKHELDAMHTPVRQRCDAQSFSGHGCVASGLRAFDAHEHSNGEQLLLACDCGATQHTLDDPFDERTAAQLARCATVDEQCGSEPLEACERRRRFSSELSSGTVWALCRAKPTTLSITLAANAGEPDACRVLQSSFVPGTNRLVAAGDGKHCVGYEYECRDAGHRFFLTRDVVHRLRDITTHSASVLCAAIEGAASACQLPIFLACVGCASRSASARSNRSSSSIPCAQLSRVFVYSSAASLVIQPLVQFEWPSASLDFGIGRELIIEQPGPSLYVLALPRFYHHQAKPIVATGELTPCKTTLKQCIRS